ncbi:lipoprotein-anchoring transpeptidase ErfK/SrfK [Bradyrhizobium sp. USDA 4454]
MSMKFAVALAATLGAVVVMSQTAEARPEMVGIHADNYEPGTIVVKTNERRLYLILDSGHAMRYPVGVGRSGKQWGRHHQDRRQISQPGLVAARRGQARQAEHAGRDRRRLAA